MISHFVTTHQRNQIPELHSTLIRQICTQLPIKKTKNRQEKENYSKKEKLKIPIHKLNDPKFEEKSKVNDSNLKEKLKVPIHKLKGSNLNGVTLQIGANHYSALIDSGAGISAISLKFQQNKPILQNIKLEKTIPTEIYGANQQDI